MQQTKQQLIDEVIEGLKEDFSFNDYTVLEELLKSVPVSNLIHSLPEKEHGRYIDLIPAN